jgi:hypothetical protein
MSTLNVNKIADASGGVLAPISSVMRNRIINGAMVIDQRNAGASVTPTASGYTLDRWRAGLSVSSKFSVQQNAGSVTPPVGFKNYLGVTSLSSYTVGAGEVFNIAQFIEGFNAADLDFGTANAKTITLSFWVYSSLTGTFGGALSNDARNRSYPFSYTISAANTWEYKTITIAGDTSGTWLTSNNVGIRLEISMGAGSTFSGTAGAWAGSDFRSATGATSVVGTNGATFYITGVQLEVGTQATSFEYRQYGTELQLCQRYYQMVTYAGKQYQAICLATALDSTTVSTNFTLKTSMRGTPSLRYTSGNYYFWYSALTGFAFSTFDIDTNYTTGECVNLYTTGVSGATAGRSGTIAQSNTLGALAFSAEL